MEQILTELFSKIKPKRIIETGTHFGTGTTTHLYRAIKNNNLNCVVETIECNPGYYQKSKCYFTENNMTDVVTQHYGLSIPKSLLLDIDQIQTITVEQENTENGKIYYDHPKEKRAELYFNETNFECPDNMLVNVINKSNESVDVFLLDSAGHIGNIEFLYLFDFLKNNSFKVNSPFYLILDDIFHCKHVNTFRFLSKQNNCEIIHESHERFGWGIVKINNMSF